MSDAPTDRPTEPATPHTERRHVETYCSPGVAPEMLDHPPIKPEPGGHAQSDDVDAGLIAMVGMSAVLLLTIIIVLLQAWYYGWADAERAAKSQTPLELTSMIADQETQLHGYRWINEPKQIVQIDIEQAMKHVVADEAKTK